MEEKLEKDTVGNLIWVKKFFEKVRAISHY